MENTYTFTARSSENPQKVATFTLDNGSVQVQLGDALIEQATDASLILDRDEDMELQVVAKPFVTGLLQRSMRPLPVTDFEATLDQDRLKTTAWVRQKGLRVAPISVTWNHVDNPDAAASFVKEVEARQQVAASPQTFPSIFDYWLSWMLLATAVVLLPVLWWQKQKSSE